MADLLKDATIKVSSVLNKDHKQFGKKFLTDKNLETCWNSAQGQNQYIQIEFPAPCSPKELEIMFQGGFAGQTCQFLVENGDEFKLAHIFYPADNNLMQQFDLGQIEPITKCRILFVESTDFYGRITVYHLSLK